LISCKNVVRDFPAGRGFPDAEGVLEEGVAAVKVTAQDPHDPLQTDVPRYYEVRRRELVRGRVSVGAHLLHTASAHSGADLRGQSLGVWVIRPGRAPVLPAIDRISPPLGVGRPPVTQAMIAAWAAPTGRPSIPTRSSSHPIHRCKVVIRACR